MRNHNYTKLKVQLDMINAAQKTIKLNKKEK